MTLFAESKQEVKLPRIRYPYKEIRNTFLAEEPIVLKPRFYRDRASDIDFSYVPSRRLRPEGDLDNIIFRPESNKSSTPRKYFRKSEQLVDPDFFKPEEPLTKPVNVKMMDSTTIFQLLGRKLPAE